MTPPSKAWLWIFWLAVITDLTAVYFQWNEVRYVSKPAIVLSLLIYFSVSVKNIPGTLFFKLALLLSIAGDVALLFDDGDPLYFMLGLGSFLMAHIAYIIAFIRIGNRHRQMQNDKAWPAPNIWRIATTLYVIVLYLTLKPYLTGLAMPVLVYACVLGLMLMTVAGAFPRLYSRPGIICLAGALFFVISDSLLAINKFYMGFPYAGILIMLTYALAQYLLTTGAVRTYSNPNFAPHPAS